MKKFLNILLGFILIVICLTSPASARTIIGDDDRIAVGDTSVSPYNAVANLTIYYPNNVTRYGTAFLISSTTLATAGHVIDHNDYGRALKIKVELGDAPGVTPGGARTQTIYASNLHCPSVWSSSRAIKNDYGVIVLNTAVSGITPFTLSTVDTIEEGNTIKIAGYDYKTAQQWRCTGTLETKFTSGRLDYRLDTLPGMSGSPVYKGTRTVVGINTYDVGAGAGVEWVPEDYNGCNTATGITTTVKNYLLSF